MGLIKITKGVYAKVNESKVTHLTIPADGWPGAKRNTYMACSINFDGSIQPIVVGVPLSKAKKMIQAWGSPFDPFVPLEEIKKAFE